MGLLNLLFIFGLLTSCGKNSPFDERSWVDPNVRKPAQNTNQESNNLSYTVTLATLSTNVGNIAGTSTLHLDQNVVTTTTEITDVPQTLALGERSISTLTCNQIASTYPPPVTANNASQFRSINTTVVGTRDALIIELNQLGPQNGNSVDLAGKTFVVRAYIQNGNTPVPQTFSLFPVACGIIQVKIETPSTSGTGTGTGGTSSGTTTNGGVGGTISGSATGSVNGGGGIGGTISGSATGSINGGGGIGGSISGATGGSIGGTTGF